jgi:ribosomal 50S subunit-recycling heat shock protein
MLSPFAFLQLPFFEMRLDLFLKISRLVPRRSLAQEFCDAGLVSVNDAPAKSSKEIKADDVIEIRRRNQMTKVRVARIPDTKQVSKDSAGDLYEVLEEVRLENDPFI